MEQTELFVRGIGEATDVVSKEMFTAVSGENLKRLIDGGTIKSKSRLSLRPEALPASCARWLSMTSFPRAARPRN